MKEIDFIPEWYKASCVRKRRYTRQYALVAAFFAIMMLWSFIADSFVDHASAEVNSIQEAFENAKMRIDQTIRMEGEIAVMKNQAEMLDRITPRTPVTAVLGELSYLIQENIILSKLTLKETPLEDSGARGVGHSVAVVQVDRVKKDSDPVVPQSPTRIQCVITGIAARPADAAAMIARLEETDYFEQVELVFSKPKEIQNKDVTEFEIRCYVADYQIRK